MRERKREKEREREKEKERRGKFDRFQWFRNTHRGGDTEPRSVFCCGNITKLEDGKKLRNLSKKWEQ